MTLVLAVPPAQAQQVSHMVRHGSRDPHRRLVLRNRHHDLAGVEHLRRLGEAWRGSVDVVADDRPAAGGAVHPELMGAAGHRGEGKPGEQPAGFRV
jgi:hypothetical protein